MSRISQLINEITVIGPDASHRNAIQIHKILEGNQKLFLTVIDPDTLTPILNNFGRLADASAKEFNSPVFSQDYSRAYQLLSFYLNKVI